MLLLLLIGLSGSNVLYQVPVLGDYLNPQFVPFSELIIFTAPKYQGIFICDRNGEDFKKLSERRGYRPSFSLDGERFVIGQDRSLVIINIKTGEERIIKFEEGIGYPLWLKNGDIVVPVNEDLVFMDEFGTRKRVIKGIPTSWISANENSIVYQYQDKVFLGDTLGNIKLLTPEQGRYYAPILSPDGKMVVVNSMGVGIFIINLETAEVISVGKGTNPRWSPDGNKIVYEITEDNGEEITSSAIYLFDLEKRRRLKLATDDLIALHPDFSPDAKEVIFCTLDGRIFILKLGDKK